MTTLITILVIIAAILVVLFLVGFVAGICDEADRHAEIARVNRERRLAEARISQVTAAAIRQMTDAATPHASDCRCARCARQGGRR